MSTSPRPGSPDPEPQAQSWATRCPPPIRRGLTAAVGLVATVLVASGCTGRATTSTGATLSASMSATPSPGGTSDWEPLRQDSSGFLTPGRLGMTANGRPGTPWAVIDVPERFSSIDGWVIFDEDPRAGGGGVGYWTISEVVPDPCGDAAPVAVGPRVEDVVGALRRQRLTRTTEPVPVEVDGHRGLSIELRVPDGIDFATCPDYNLWESDPAGARHMSAAGEFDRLWVLDVAGEVVVLTVTANTSVPESTLRRLTTMVEGVEFVPRDA